MARKLYRLGLFAAHHRWVVIAAWVVAVVVVRPRFAPRRQHLQQPRAARHRQPGRDGPAERALSAPAERQNPIVFHARGTGRSPTPRTSRRSGVVQGDQAAAARLQRDEPVQPEGHAAQISDDKQTAFFTVLLDIGNEDVTEELAQRFLDAAEPGRKAGMEVAAGGQIGTELSEPETESSERDRPDRRDDDPHAHLRHAGGDGDGDRAGGPRAARRALGDRPARPRAPRCPRSRRRWRR